MRARLLTGFLLFVLAVMLAFGLPIGFTQQARDRNAAHQTLRRAANSLAVIVSDALDHHDPSRAHEAVKRYADNADFRADVLIGRSIVVSSAASPSSKAPASLYDLASKAGTKISTGTGMLFDEVGPSLYATLALHPHPAADGGQRGAIVISQSARTLNDQIREDWLKLVALGASVLAAAAILGLVLSSSLIRPLRRIERAVTEIGDGSLDARAPADSGPSELRTLARAVNSTADRLSRLLHAQRSFAADASHQLRTPLTAIRLQLEQAQRRATSPSPEVDAALGEVRRLSGMVNVLLELARREGERPPGVAVDVGELIGQRLDSWRPFAEEQGITLAGKPSDTGPLVVLAAPDTLEQVIDNLLENACDASPAGASVRVFASEVPPFAEIHVVDEGKGLAPGEHERAFDRFWRAGNARPGGSGLGLAIVDHLVRLAGGTVELRPRPAGGTDAVVRLPLAKTA